MTGEYRTDWLGLPSLFYNEKTGRVGNTIHDVVDYGEMEFHPEGLANYLDAGFSVLGQTPLRDVRFLLPSSRLTRSDDGRITIEIPDDPVEKLMPARSTAAGVLEMLEERVRQWEARTAGPIVLPLSGGYDSRLLASFCREREMLRAFSYGLCDRQERSCEIVYARAVADALGIQWSPVPLGKFHRFFDDWESLYGPAVHAHGMYQFEFYESLRASLGPGETALLSGIIGDGWSGGAAIGRVDTPGQVLHLSYSHGMCADSGQMLHPVGERPLVEGYFARNREKLREEPFRVVEAMRMKLLLLSYLFRVPESFGFRPWSPFLDRDIALAMVALPREDRRGRRWQRDYFAGRGLLVEERRLSCSWANTLNHQGMEAMLPPPLDARLLGEVVRPEYVEGINAALRGKGIFLRLKRSLMRWRYGAGGLRRLGLDRRLKAYLAYLTLRPLENALRRRDAVRRGAR